MKSENIDVSKPYKKALNLQAKALLVLALSNLILVAAVVLAVRYAGKEMLFSATHKDDMAYWMEIRSQADKKTASESAAVKKANDDLARTEPSLLFTN